MRPHSPRQPQRRTARRTAAAGWSALVSGLLIPVAAGAANYVVTALPNLTFSPSNITIAPGDTITFRNGGGVHNAVSNPGAVTSFRCANGCDATGGNGNPSGAAWSATVAFPANGIIGYYCSLHGSPNVGMIGRILVAARRSDFNRDGRSDILWRNGSTGANVIWRSASMQNPQAVGSVTVLDWKVVP